MSETIERWGLFEAALEAPVAGNPFTDVTLSAVFRHAEREVVTVGFYDGDGVWRLRFMPDTEGEWTWRTASDHPELDGEEGAFACVAPAAGNHGPVKVADRYHFAYADGTYFSNIGTTCYAWVHQDPQRVEQTLKTLATAPFNKIRMCVMPKSYRFNENEPQYYPFPVLQSGSSQWDSNQPCNWKFDLARFEPAFFRHFEQCVARLGELGIEADVILFHPYDRWGFATMPADVEDRYLRYICARLSAYRNIWWSFANEWDLFRGKTIDDWERYADLVCRCDPYDHLRSIHNCRTNYDHSKKWVTHVSFQGHPDQVGRLREAHGKPVVVDECCYEGDIPNGWGNISAEELTWRFWLAVACGGYCGHGETYMHPEDVLWWSKGGMLHGKSPERIAFLRKILEQHAGGGFEPCAGRKCPGVCRGDGEILFFNYNHQPCRLEVTLPEGADYAVEMIDPWEMTARELPDTYRGACAIPLPVRPYLVVRALRQAVRKECVAGHIEPARQRKGQQR